MRRFFPVLTLALAILGCGGGGGDDDTGPPADTTPANQPTAIGVTPVNYTIVVENAMPRTLQYHAVGTYADGHTADITADVSWTSYDPSLISLNADGMAVTSNQLGGTTTIKATLGAISGETTAHIVQRTVVIGAGATDGTPDQFDMASLDTTPSRAPGIMYPSDQTILPPNFPGLEFQFLRGSGNDVFELAIDVGDRQYRQYGGCAAVGPGCFLTPPNDAWDLLKIQVAGRDVQVKVSGLTTATPDTKGTSSPRTLRFTSDELTAGLYYWAATVGRLYRFDFGHAGVPAELFYTSPTGGCVGCHTLSRDGTLAAIGVDGPSPSRLDVVDVASGALLWYGQGGTSQGANYQVFSPDNSKILTTDGYSLRIRDAMTGADLPGGDLNQPGSLFPDWSADGALIVYTKKAIVCGSSPCSDFTCDNGSIVTQTWDGTTFGAPSTIVPFDGSYNNYYPAFTPDSSFIVFNRTDGMGMFGGGFGSYDNRDATMWAVPILGGTPQRLYNADGGYKGDSWPKVSPKLLSYSGGSIAFITFSSRRAIGIRPDTQTAQIWMAAFDPAIGLLGMDPSFPAVHLPWQDTTSGNHIAGWATDIPHEPCGPGGTCPGGEFCQDGECVPDIG